MRLETNSMIIPLKLFFSTSHVFLILSIFQAPSTLEEWIRTPSQYFTTHMNQYFHASAFQTGLYAHIVLYTCRHMRGWNQINILFTHLLSYPDGQYTQVCLRHPVCTNSLQHTHTHTVFTLGKWLPTLLILTITRLCVLCCHYVKLLL